MTTPVAPSSEAPGDFKELLEELFAWVNYLQECSADSPGDKKAHAEIAAGGSRLESLWASRESERNAEIVEARRTGRAEGYSMAAKDAIQTGHASQSFIDHQELLKLGGKLSDLRDENTALRSELEGARAEIKARGEVYGADVRNAPRLLPEAPSSDSGGEHVDRLVVEEVDRLRSDLKPTSAK